MKIASVVSRKEKLRRAIPQRSIMDCSQNQTSISGMGRTRSFEVHSKMRGWSISVSMQPINTKLSKKMKLVTKAHFDKQLSQ